MPPHATTRHDPHSPAWHALIAMLTAVALDVVSRLRIVTLSWWEIALLAAVAAALSWFITLIQENNAASAGWSPTYIYRIAAALLPGIWATWVAGWRWTPWMVLAGALLTAALGIVGAAIPTPDPPARRPEQLPGPLDAPAHDRRHPVVREWETLIRKVTKLAVVVTGWQPWEAQADGLRLHVELPDGITISEFATFCDKLAHARRLPDGCAIRVEGSGTQGRVVVDVMLRNTLLDKRLIHVEPTTPASINDSFPVLVTPRGPVLSVCLRIFSMIVGGTTGSGKTTLLHRIIMWLARCTDALVWVVDLNGGGLADPWIYPWATGRATAPVVDWVADNEADAAVMVAVAGAIAKDRKTNPEARQRRRGANSTVLPVDDGLPAIVVITDEGGEVRQAAGLLGQLVGQGITRLAQIGRAEGVRAIMSVLRGTADLLDKGLRVVAALRLCLRMEEEDEYSYVLGANPGKTALTGAGSAFLRTDAITRPALGSTLPVDLAGIDAHAVACARLRPRLDAWGLRAAAKVTPSAVIGGRDPADFMALAAMRDCAEGRAYEGRWDRYAGKLAEMRGEEWVEEEPERAVPAAAAPSVAAEGGSAVSAFAAAVNAAATPGPAPTATADDATIIPFPPQPGRQPADTAREQILALVRAAGPAGISAADLERGVTATRSRVYEVMRQLRDDEQLISRNSAGLYVAARAATASSG